MALKRSDGKKFRWGIYSSDEDWAKVIKLQEHLRLRTRQDVIDIAVENFYDKVFSPSKNENKEE